MKESYNFTEIEQFQLQMWSPQINFLGCFEDKSNFENILGVAQPFWLDFCMTYVFNKEHR